MNFLVKNILLFVFCTCTISIQAQVNMLITEFGAIGDGKTDNTVSIQNTIDKAATEGGGKVIVPKGQFVTGPIFLKSGVELHLLKEGVLLGSSNRLDYGKGNAIALINALDQQNISITGKGEINGRGQLVVNDVIRLLQEGVLQDIDWPKKRPYVFNRPKVIHLLGCTNVLVKGITVTNGAAWVTDFSHCNTVTIDSITILSTEYWNNDGIDICDSKNVSVTNSYINTADDAICLKSENGLYDSCVNIYIANCRLRSSASAFKIGTASWGGFRNITVRDITVFDTFRSAVALEAVDGGFLENVAITNIKATSTGNAIFIRLGHRNTDSHYSSVKNIYLANFYVEVPAGKPDKGYMLEGPLLKYPPGILPDSTRLQSVSPQFHDYADKTAILYKHNVFPSSITGLPGHPVENVTLKNIEIVYEGGANKDIAYFPVDSLSLITEAEASYPEFSMFGELPAWGLFVRHAKGISMSNVTMHSKNEDYRVPFIFDDVKELEKVNVKSIPF